MTPLVDPVMSLNVRLPPTPGIAFNPVVVMASLIAFKFPETSPIACFVLENDPPPTAATAAAPRRVKLLDCQSCFCSVLKS